MIDFRALSYFVVACEHENLGAAAQELGIAPSTLGASLKSLETKFGASLFQRQGVGLSPRQLARWLYRAALPLLLLEEFTRRRISAPANAEAVRLRIDLKVPFGFDQLSRAVSRAIKATSSAEPLVLADPVWTAESGTEFGAALIGSLGFAGERLVTIEARPALPGEGVLLEDPWVIVRRQIVQESEAAIDLRKQPIFLPALSPSLIDLVVEYARTNGIKQLVQLSSPPDAWQRMLEDHPGGIFLLPLSGFKELQAVGRLTGQPLSPPLATQIVAVTGGDPFAERFVARLRIALAQDRPPASFKPVLTTRRIRYFNLAHDLGRVSAAARVAGVAQPALTQQLQKLEASVGAALFERNTQGLLATAAGTQFARASALLDQRLREIEVSGMSAALAEGGRLSLGVLPSVSHHGHLISRVTEAVLALRELYPAMTMTIEEAPNDTLQNWVARGRVGLAVVETVLPQLPRLPLDAAEELCVIVNPHFALLAPGPVRLRDVADLPLVLPSSLFGIRQVVDAMARNVRIELRPRHEINALPMLVATLLREPFATILTASALQRELESGELAAHAIIEPTILRKLFVVYSGDRSLTPAERDLVRLLRAKLALSIAQIRPQQSTPISSEATTLL